MPPPEPQDIELRVFDALRHGDFALTRPPEGLGRIRREQPQRIESFHHAPAVSRTRCASDGCQNATAQKVQDSWLCHQCEQPTSCHNTTAGRARMPGAADRDCAPGDSATVVPHRCRCGGGGL